jgi:hypothetical protein
VTDAIKLTGEGIARALRRVAALPAVDAALRERAEQVAREMGEAQVLWRGDGDYVVVGRPVSVGAESFSAVMPAKAGTGQETLS